MDRYKHLGLFLLVWVLSMDLYEHRQAGIGVYIGDVLAGCEFCMG